MSQKFPKVNGVADVPLGGDVRERPADCGTAEAFNAARRWRVNAADDRLGLPHRVGAERGLATIGKRTHIQVMNLDLTDEETTALTRLLSTTIAEDRYPLSARIEMLKGILGEDQTGAGARASAAGEEI
jgi:hypothetical protein